MIRTFWPHWAWRFYDQNLLSKGHKNKTEMNSRAHLVFSHSIKMARRVSMPILNRITENDGDSSSNSTSTYSTSGSSLRPGIHRKTSLFQIQEQRPQNIPGQKLRRFSAEWFANRSGRIAKSSIFKWFSYFLSDLSVIDWSFLTFFEKVRYFLLLCSFLLF